MGYTPNITNNNNDHKLPTVSIGMPVHNGEEYICQAIDSLLSQSFFDFELIISDNASNDNTRKICESYMHNDKRVRYFLQEKNMGAAWNFQYVLLKAKGTYFMWAASDDMWAYNWLEVLLNFIKEDDFSVRGKIHFMEHSRIAYIKQAKNYYKNNLIKFFLLPETLYNARHFYIYGLFKTDKLRKIDRKCLEYDWHPDFLYVYKMLQHGNLRTTSETYQIYRINQEGEGTKLVKKQNRIKRFLYRAHPGRYYTHYLNLTPKNKYWQIAIMVPIKYIYNQIYLWFRVTPNILKKMIFNLLKK